MPDACLSCSSSIRISVVCLSCSIIVLRVFMRQSCSPCVHLSVMCLPCSMCVLLSVKCLSCLPCVLLLVVCLSCSVCACLSILCLSVPCWFNALSSVSCSLFARLHVKILSWFLFAHLSVRKHQICLAKTFPINLVGLNMNINTF